VAWVRERTISSERPPLVGEVSANFCVQTDRWLFASTEMQVLDRIQEATRREGRYWCCNCWTMEIHKATKFAVEILCRLYLQCLQNRFILSYYARLFHKLQTPISTWFKAGNGSCNCVVLFKKSLTDKLTLLVIGESAKPGFFREFSMNNSPVLYYANKSE
jgi:hypothetical protein